MQVLIAILTITALAAWADCALVNDKVEFLLYQRGVSNKRVDNSDRLSGLPSSFKSRAKTYFVIHGWNGRLDTWFPKMIKALLKKEDANVFTVDWGHWAKTPNYLAAKNRADDAGVKVASFIKSLEKKTGASRKRMHLIGHSLGGQVAGFAGAHLTSPKVARITGLDTSGIAFKCLSNENDCLDSTDADFVDEIHSLVSVIPKGHADFYALPKSRS